MHAAVEVDRGCLLVTFGDGDAVQVTVTAVQAKLVVGRRLVFEYGSVR